jgi:acyl-coenzyme A thioesterase PaaI-like protein
VGTQFGGSLFSMTDPWWMIMLLNRLGKGYIVWDKAAEIDFVAPGRGTVRAVFSLPDSVVEEVREQASDGKPVLRWFEVSVLDADGTLVSRVRKQVYIRRKP